jgi:hypothetical protein
MRLAGTYPVHILILDQPVSPSRRGLRALCPNHRDDHHHHGEHEEYGLISDLSHGVSATADMLSPPQSPVPGFGYNKLALSGLPSQFFASGGGSRFPPESTLSSGISGRFASESVIDPTNRNGHWIAAGKRQFERLVEKGVNPIVFVLLRRRSAELACLRLRHSDNSTVMLTVLSCFIRQWRKG